MADDITNIVLLQHIHAMKTGLEQQISNVDRRIASLEQKVDTNTIEMRKGFQEAGEHRQALQEDLEETIRVLSKHEKRLARL